MRFFKKESPLFILFLISISLIGIQISLMQTLAFSQWSHFASMIISVAMLGFAASATAVSLKKDAIINNKNIIIPCSICVCSILTIFIPTVLNSEILMFDTLLIFSQKTHLLRLTGIYLYLFLLFFSGAITIGIIFTHSPLNINKLYFANLIGSGVGTIVSALTATLFFPRTTFSIFAIITASSLFFAIESKKHFFALFFSFVIILSFLNIAHMNPLPQISQYKSLSKTLTLPDAEIVLSKPTKEGILNIVESNNLRYAPGLSLLYTGEINAHSAVFVNGNLLANNTYFSKSDTTHILDYSTQNLPYALGKNFKRAAFIYPGSYSKIALAYKNGVDEIELIEPNKTLFHVNKNYFAHINDSLLYKNNIKVHPRNARSFLASSRSKYDLIDIHLPDAFGGTSGLFSFNQQYHLTIEAFENMWHILDDSGYITLSSWLDYPPRTPLKIFATLHETLNQFDKNPKQHIVAIKNWSNITFLVKKSPFTSNELNNIKSFANSMSFDVAISPDNYALENRDKFNKVPDTAFYEIIDSVMVGNFAVLDDYLFNISPATDDNPFFSNFLKLKNLKKVINHTGMQSLAFFETGFIFSVVSVAKTAIISFILIIIPLIFFKLKLDKSKQSGIKNVVIYFACLGTGYMLIEILMLQRLSYYLETHILGATVTIGTLLISSGFGSYFSPIFDKTPKMRFAPFIFIAAITLAYTFFGDNFIVATISAPLWLRVFLAIFFIAILGFFLGIPFPTGLKIVAKKSEALVPFAWGINGCFSVVSASAALLIAISTGYKIVLLISVVSYILALISIAQLQSKRK